MVEKGEGAYFVGEVGGVNFGLVWWVGGCLASKTGRRVVDHIGFVAKMLLLLLLLSQLLLHWSGVWMLGIAYLFCY